MDSFAGHPVSIGEARSVREHDCRLWSPRDALVNTLRDLDEGKINPTDLLICWATTSDDGAVGIFQAVSAHSGVFALGMVSRVAQQLGEQMAGLA